MKFFHISIVKEKRMNPRNNSGFFFFLIIPLGNKKVSWNSNTLARVQRYKTEITKTVEEIIVGKHY